jgi:hypothetical protein
MSVNSVLPPPRRHQAANAERDLSAPYYSITSSATASSVGVILMPGVRAVCKLMTNSNLVGRIDRDPARFVLSQHHGLHRVGFGRADVNVGERLSRWFRARRSRRQSFRQSKARGSGAASWSRPTIAAYPVGRSTARPGEALREPLDAQTPSRNWRAWR